MKLFIEKEFNDYKLPIVVKYDHDYYTKLSLTLDKYEQHICGLNNIDIEVKEKVKNNINLIKQSLSYYVNAKLDLSKKCIKDIIENYIPKDNNYSRKSLIVSNIDRCYAFKGIAPFKDLQKKYNYIKTYEDEYKMMNDTELTFFKSRNSIEDLTKEEMLHIPFNKRGKINTQRFSIPGVPCTYLSTTSYGCWREMNMPEPDIFFVSAYKINSSLKVLNLCVSQYVIDGLIGGGWVEESDISILYMFLEIFPLVCATSFRVLEDNRSFKSEYIISQLLMQVVNELGIEAIAYFSRKTKELYAAPQCVNIAISMPANKTEFHDSDNFNISSNTKKIQLTNPYNFIDFLEMKDFKIDEYLSYVNKIYHNSGFNNRIELYGAIENEYTKTKFAEFDEFLVRQKYYKI